jgi:hypothetical protein
MPFPFRFANQMIGHSLTRLRLPSLSSQTPLLRLLLPLPPKVYNQGFSSLSYSSISLDIFSVFLFSQLFLLDLLSNLQTTKRALDSLKKSPEPMMGYYFYSVLLRYPFLVNKPLVNSYLDKIHAVLTNVPGPLNPITFAGRRILKYVPVIPQPGPDGGLGLGILSYAGKVVVSVQTQHHLHSGDQHLPGGPKALTEASTREFQELLKEAKKKIVS